MIYFELIKYFMLHNKACGSKRKVSLTRPREDLGNTSGLITSEKLPHITSNEPQMINSSQYSSPEPKRVKSSLNIHPDLHGLVIVENSYSDETYAHILHRSCSMSHKDFKFEVSRTSDPTMPFRLVNFSYLLNLTRYLPATWKVKITALNYILYIYNAYLISGVLLS